MNNLNAYSFIIAFILMTFFSVGIFAVRPIIFGTGALSYTAMLFWLFSFRGYDMREANELVLPYFLCWAGVTIGITITATRSHVIKMSIFRIILETFFFTIFIGLWPFYPRFFATLNNTTIK
jgi:hypothetical protein